MPAKHNKSKHGGKKGGQSGPKRLFAAAVAMGMAGTSAADHFIRSDLSMRPVPGMFKASIPKNMSNQIVWQRTSYQQYLTLSTSTSTEQNFAPTISGGFCQQYASWCVLFDQYFLHSFTVTLANNAGEGSLGTLPQVYTAIDYDSSANLGSIGAISAYGSCNVTTLAPGASVTRFVQPCNASYLAATAGSGVARQWVDSSVTSILFYGIRTITAQVTVVSQLDITATLNWCFRNTV